MWRVSEAKHNDRGSVVFDVLTLDSGYKWKLPITGKANLMRLGLKEWQTTGLVTGHHMNSG